MRYEITIETQPMEGGMHRASVVTGPKQFAGHYADGYTRAEALTALREDIQAESPRRDTFEFLHVHA